MARLTGERLLGIWRRLSPLPGGRYVFSRMLGWAVPYTGSIRAEVISLSPGHARIRMKDRRRVRNHLDSIHAVALANLAEATTGLAILSMLPPDARGILVGISMEYLKKARGELVASSDCAFQLGGERREYPVQGSITDSHGEVVARVRARWLIGP